MIRDAWTVMRKDLQELRSLRSQGLSGIISTLLILIIFGVIVPWRFDVGWDAHPASPLLWVWLPWLPAAVVVADTFAGERERHTLDALYVTRLSNDAILLGKVGGGAICLACRPPYPGFERGHPSHHRQRRLAIA